MRKKTLMSSPKGTRKPRASALQLKKETIRTLSADELEKIQTGIVLLCPTYLSSPTQTLDTDLPPDHNKR